MALNDMLSMTYFFNDRVLNKNYFCGKIAQKMWTQR